MTQPKVLIEESKEKCSKIICLLKHFIIDFSIKVIFYKKNPCFVCLCVCLQLMGLWYGAEIITHHETEAYETVYDSCVVVHLADANEVSTKITFFKPSFYLSIICLVACLSAPLSYVTRGTQEAEKYLKQLA